jgi:simple sugar transport system permease protein
MSAALDTPQAEAQRWLRRAGPTILASTGAVALALALGALVILSSGQDPVTAYRALVSGAFGDRRGIAETLVATTPYILGGLAFAVAFRAGMFNIGIEGQIVIGGLACGLVGAYDLGLPPVIFLPLALAVVALAGGLWGAIAGALKAISGAHEVITTIMLNYLAFRLLTYVLTETESWLPVNTQLQATKPVQPEARLPNLLERTRLHAGIIVALAAALVLWLLLYRTAWGYRLRTVGYSRGAAAFAGFSWGRVITGAMFVSGALAGLAGAGETLGLQGKQISAPQGYGFTAIAVGLVGRNHPAGVVLSGLLFGILRSGATEMQNTAGTSKELVLVLQGLIILAVAALVSASRLQRWWERRARLRRAQVGERTTVGVEPDSPPSI